MPLKILVLALLFVLSSGLSFRQQESENSQGKVYAYRRSFPYEASVGDDGGGSVFSREDDGGGGLGDDVGYGGSGGHIAYRNPSSIFQKTFSLYPVGPNGVSATATVTVDSGKMSVDVEIDAGQTIPFPKSYKPCHIHYGDCPSGDAAYNLTSIAPKGGRGSFTSFAVINSMTPTYSFRYFLLSNPQATDDGAYLDKFSVNIHQSEAHLENVLACGLIADFTLPGGRRRRNMRRR